MLDPRRGDQPVQPAAPVRDLPRDPVQLGDPVPHVHPVVRHRRVELRGRPLRYGRVLAAGAGLGLPVEYVDFFLVLLVRRYLRVRRVWGGMFMPMWERRGEG